MNSIKTKGNFFCEINKNKCIAGVVIVPYSEDGFRIYVAWETEKQAKLAFFAITTLFLTSVIRCKLEDLINKCTDYGEDVTHKKDVQKLFSNLFKV